MAFPLRPPFAEASDEAVAARVLSGERDAFRILVERHQVGIHRLASNLGPRGGCPSDLAQDVFVAAFVGLASFDPRRGTFATWLFTIARNRALNARKKKSPELATEESLERSDPGRTPDEDMQEAEVRRRLDRALAELPEDQRTSFVLDELCGLRSEEIAEIEGVSPSTIRSRVSRAKARLRDALTPFVREEP